MDDVDRKKDPIGVLRLQSLLDKSEQYNKLLAESIPKDQEHAVPLIIMAIAAQLVSKRFGILNEETTDMPGKIKLARELVSNGPEHVAAMLMCLAVETSLMMDRSSVVASLDELDRGEP